MPHTAATVAARACLIFGLGLIASGAATSYAQPPDPKVKADLDDRFATIVRPFVTEYCTLCHGGEHPKATFNLEGFTDVKAVIESDRWKYVRDHLSSKKMPPPDDDQPAPALRKQIIAWIDEAARTYANDPGPVLARRLSNAEYNYSIRDLTGVDIQPAREFPIDPSNPAGFDNSGESLAMSPTLLKKYLLAARQIASHMVLGHQGITFAPHPMLVETDRDQYFVGRIIDFYRRHKTDFADYFLAAWQYKHRAALGQPKATLAATAKAAGVSAKYLSTVWQVLEPASADAAEIPTVPTVGPIAKLQKMWRALPPPTRKAATPPAEGAARMRAFVVQLREKIRPDFRRPQTRDLDERLSPFVMWLNRQYASHRMKYDRATLQTAGVTSKTPPDPDLVAPSAARAQYEAAFAQFAAVFPDAFYIEERDRGFPKPPRDKGRLLSAGFHNLMGFFRDDQPLYQLVLDKAEQRQLDALWFDFDLVAETTRRTYVQFYFNQSGKVTRGAGAEDGSVRERAVASPRAVARLKKTFVDRARPSGNEVALDAIHDHFDGVTRTLRTLAQAQKEAEPRHLIALGDLAARAYRRPLTTRERRELAAYYRARRKRSGLDHAGALRDTLVSVLMSPDFCYRIDLVPNGPGPQALSDEALASRLSFFLWSSLPDGELLAHADAGDLHHRDVLKAQTRRMLKDPRVLGLVTEFGGQWLDFRRFESHNNVDRLRFPSFDQRLRQAMFEEPIHFLRDAIVHDRPVLDVVLADWTFVNPTLAKHYGLPYVAPDKSRAGGGHDRWVRAESVARRGRGGVLPMAALLTQNAPGLRTSPVKRGYWVVKKLLGEHIPPPPAMVPELPRDEAEADLSMRELLAQHREDPACAACHARFDAMGLVFEGYGPIGERRDRDLAGRPVDVRAEFPGGQKGKGLEGLRDYIRTERQDDFVDNLTRKLLSYALGRSLALFDEPLVADVKHQLAQDGYRWGRLIESVVLSPQFRTKRGGPIIASRKEP